MDFVQPGGVALAAVAVPDSTYPNSDLASAFFNVSVVLALVPTKGITLPFISYGGTSLFFTLASVGVLLNLSREID